MSEPHHPGSWRGPFYVAPDDPRLIVPKRNPGFGWTINFGRPAAVPLFVGMILGALAIPVVAGLAR